MKNILFITFIALCYSCTYTGKVAHMAKKSHEIYIGGNDYKNTYRGENYNDRIVFSEYKALLDISLYKELSEYLNNLKKIEPKCEAYFYNRMHDVWIGLAICDDKKNCTYITFTDYRGIIRIRNNVDPLFANFEQMTSEDVTQAVQSLYKNGKMYHFDKDLYEFMKRNLPKEIIETAPSSYPH